MSSLPVIALGFTAVLVGIVNLAYFRDRQAWRGGALAFGAALGAAASSAVHNWWLAVPQLLLVAWGLAILGTAKGKRP